jgi:hypothetical protein
MWTENPSKMRPSVACIKAPTRAFNNVKFAETNAIKNVAKNLTDSDIFPN